ncbi:MAG: SNF2-related protein [Candidatus Methanoperedens sp.]|nr:SNF2-related protein [Candidatus Methanoperedens sp.]
MALQLTFERFLRLQSEQTLPQQTQVKPIETVAIKPAEEQPVKIEELPVKSKFSWDNVIDFSKLSGVILPGIFPLNFKSEVVSTDSEDQDSFDPGNISFITAGDPNEKLWDSVRAGKINQDKIFSEYKSLGQTVKIEGNRGIPDLNKKRELNLQQHFTPPILAHFLAHALGLSALDPATPASVADNSCGIGRMFQYLNSSCKLLGIEKEEKAYHMARALFPQANIIRDDLINHPEITADFFIINPPFSIQLEKVNCGFENAGWGDLGPKTSIKSHIAALEAAINGARYYVAAMMPQGYFTNEDTLTFERWVNQRAQLIYRLDIGAKAFKKYGFNWPCSIMIYKTYELEEFIPQIHHQIDDELDDDTLQRELNILTALEAGKCIKRAIAHIRERGEIPCTKLTIVAPPETPQARVRVPLTGDKGVKMCLSPDASRLNFKTYDLLTAMKVHEYLEGMGSEWNEGTKDYTKISEIKLRRSALLDLLSFREIDHMKQVLERMGIEVTLDQQALNWISKRREWLRRQMAPFEQYINKDGEWICLHEKDGIKSLFPEMYKQRLARMDTLGISKWLWGFQREDVARMSMKDSNLLCWSMGLGKTRAIIALALMYGVKHSLIIVEPKLKAEFAKEFKNLGITDFQIIESEKDLKDLKRFNIVSYNTLWRPLNNHTNKTFAKAMRRRFQFIAVDEAHKIKAKDSQQAMAVRMLKSRYKLLSTGTPIANYPRNIFSLLVFGWGDATERNRYGYYGPIEHEEDGRKRGWTSGTRQFKNDFVEITWVTPQFEQTLDSGAKSREMPKIKDTEKWWQMMCSKIIRRQREEPDVKIHVKFPKPKIYTELIKMSPDQVKHYKIWLDRFAEWFKKQLDMEAEGGHKIDQMMVLAHLTQLQFASTIPQSPKTNTREALWNFGDTTKQERVVELIKEAIANSEKTIVFSERPEFQKHIQEKLKELGIKSHLFIGDQGIKERNILLDDFKSNGTHVLLATTTCGETGLNIPEANVVIIADTSWTPSKQIQAYSRILRPQQKKKPRIYLLRAKGTIDEYMQQLMDAKTEAINEGIDYQQAAEFDPEKWLTYKDFTLKMLKEEGYEL